MFLSLIKFGHGPINSYLVVGTSKNHDEKVKEFFCGRQASDLFEVSFIPYNS